LEDLDVDVRILKWALKNRLEGRGLIHTHTRTHTPVRTTKANLNGKFTTTFVNINSVTGIRYLISDDKGKGESKVHPGTGHEGPQQELYSFFNIGGKRG
jgi:hypothetical protein